MAPLPYSRVEKIISGVTSSSLSKASPWAFLSTENHYIRTPHSHEQIALFSFPIPPNLVDAKSERRFVFYLKQVDYDLPFSQNYGKVLYPIFYGVLWPVKMVRPFLLQKLRKLLFAFKILKKVRNRPKEGVKPHPRHIASKALINKMEFGINIQGVIWKNFKIEWTNSEKGKERL